LTNRHGTKKSYNKHANGGSATLVRLNEDWTGKKLSKVFFQLDPQTIEFQGESWKYAWCRVLFIPFIDLRAIDITVEATGVATQGNVAVGSFVFLTKVVAPLICYNVCAIKLSLKSSLFSHQGQVYKTFTVVTSWPEDTYSLV